jgi:hypothetical protein
MLTQVMGARELSSGMRVADALQHLKDTPMIEAYALLDGLMLAQSIGCNRFIVRTDCVSVFESIRTA